MAGRVLVPVVARVAAEAQRDDAAVGLRMRADARRGRERALLRDVRPCERDGEHGNEEGEGTGGGKSSNRHGQGLLITRRFERVDRTKMSAG
jgi:hypothetical protein